MRSPLFYPLNRAADMDVGGAADLQTDVMRFMAILSLCLVAIFALVQSMPMVPLEPVTSETEAQVIDAVDVDVSDPVPKVVTKTTVARPAPDKPEPVQRESVSLTRPKWKPAPRPEPAAERIPPPQPVLVEAAPVQEVPAPIEEPEGFSLRFESDVALTRLVAANQVGLYAMENTRARRMSISESRISFWDASTPGTFHEMERTTVPQAVVDALARTGADPNASDWGVTLPGKLRTQLDSLMQQHRGGELVIGAGGTIRREIPQ